MTIFDKNLNRIQIIEILLQKKILDIYFKINKRYQKNSINQICFSFIKQTTIFRIVNLYFIYNICLKIEKVLNLEIRNLEICVIKNYQFKVHIMQHKISVYFCHTLKYIIISQQNCYFSLQFIFNVLKRQPQQKPQKIYNYYYQKKIIMNNDFDLDLSLMHLHDNVIHSFHSDHDLDAHSRKIHISSLCFHLKKKIRKTIKRPALIKIDEGIRDVRLFSQNTSQNNLDNIDTPLM
ncbi:hypothetical protein pb186bvf_000132 [Paramecium bursaria]